MKKEILILTFIIIFSTLLVNALSLEEKFQIKECKSACKINYKNSSQECKLIYNLCREDCQNLSCERLCSYEKSSCVKSTIKSYNLCKSNCFPQEGCLNNTIKLNERFARDCDICECNKNGKLRCKRDNFCNKNISILEIQCTQSGGFYNALCNGLYFDIVCSQQRFCLCEGNFNYSCPENFSCLRNFISPNKRDTTIEGWKTLSGYALGNIGICAQ